MFPRSICSAAMFTGIVDALNPRRIFVAWIVQVIQIEKVLPRWFSIEQVAVFVLDVQFCVRKEQFAWLEPYAELLVGG